MHYVGTAVGFWSVLASASLLLAQDEPRAVVERAIKAHGGEEQVARLRTMRIKAEGSMNLLPGQPAIPFVIEDVWQMPDQYKTTLTFELNGMKVTQVQAIDDEAGWMEINGMVLDLPPQAAAEIREQKYAEDLDRLGFLNDTSIELSPIDEPQVDPARAVGVLLKSKGHRDVRLYFDGETGLLIKRQHAVLDPLSGKQVVQDVLFSDHQESDGLKHYRKIVAQRSGQKFLDAKVTEVEFFETLDDKVFDKP